MTVIAKVIRRAPKQGNRSRGGESKGTVTHVSQHDLHQFNMVRTCWHKTHDLSPQTKRGILPCDFVPKEARFQGHILFTHQAGTLWSAASHYRPNRALSSGHPEIARRSRGM
ncbi:MAG: hypothetical protein BWY63_02994 [Chloroflexi bacterium ADurb.Bin360]|nr:MAG: hypothetical protein BWY63_02994 [Chloroflexi bacterium ADurb.Bin360]